MPSAAPAASTTLTSTDWTADFDTLRREKLFRNPPTDRTAFPLLAEAVAPHVQSFDALFGPDGLVQHAVRDIGTKRFLDGDAGADGEGGDEGAGRRNSLSVRLRDVFLERPALPATNRIVAGDRSVMPAECRQRHATYRGRLRVRLEHRVNDGAWTESVRELGLMPIMLRVGPLASAAERLLLRERAG